LSVSRVLFIRRFLIEEPPEAGVAVAMTVYYDDNDDPVVLSPFAPGFFKIDKKYSNMFFMKAGENLEIGETSILALDSTDEGVAFFCKDTIWKYFSFR